MKITGVLVVTALLLVGCSSSPQEATPGSSSPATPTSSGPAATSSAPAAESSTPAAEPVTIETAEDVVTATGCTGYELADQAAPFSKSYGTCTWKGGRLQVYTFANDTDLASFWDAVRAFGVTPDQAAVVGLVVAAPESQKDLAALKAALGV